MIPSCGGAHGAKAAAPCFGSRRCVSPAFATVSAPNAGWAVASIPALGFGRSDI